jgi:hydroxyacylglutathione hydrolase
MKVSPIAAFDDNYIWIIRNGTTPDIIVVDPGDAEPVLAAIQQNGWRLRAILLTHHHYDHTDGVAELTQLADVSVYGPVHESIRGVTHPLSEGDPVDFADLGLHFRVIDTPGHTRGHLCYHGHSALFCGDTLFTAGCGRIFEGTTAQMFNSLEKIRALPTETAIYCAHEYTLQNLAFARVAEPDNLDIVERMARTEKLRAQGRPSVPSTLADELLSNPFLRCQQPVLAANAARFAQRVLSGPAEVFAVVRGWKDSLD